MLDGVGWVWVGFVRVGLGEIRVLGQVIRVGLVLPSLPI